MKHLILIRHAETAEKVTGSTDEMRELTVRGIHQAAQVGAFLHDKYQIDIIYSSNAVRARTTSEIIAEQLDLSDIQTQYDLYQASVGTLFEILRSGDEYHNVAVVAHNPTITYFAEFITDTAVEEMKPATVLILKLDIGSWKELQKGSATLLDRFEP